MQHHIAFLLNPVWLPVPLVYLASSAGMPWNKSVNWVNQQHFFGMSIYIYIKKYCQHCWQPALLVMYINRYVYIYIIYLDLYIHASHKDGIRVLVIRLSLNPLNGVSTLTAFDWWLILSSFQGLDLPGTNPSGSLSFSRTSVSLSITSQEGYIILLIL